MAPVASQFRWRSFVSFALVLSFLVAALSGVVLFLRPEGSLARWAGWAVMGADKKQWESLHIASVLLFLVLSPFHLWYNWRPLLSYLSKRLPAGPGWRPRVRPELVAALSVVALVTGGSLAGWQPFAAVNELRTSIKDGRFIVRTLPPVLDADRLTVNDVCAQVALTPVQATANAKARGVVIGDTSRTLGAVAKELGLTPEAVFEALTGTADVRP